MPFKTDDVVEVDVHVNLCSTIPPILPTAATNAVVPYLYCIILNHLLFIGVVRTSREDP